MYRTATYPKGVKWGIWHRRSRILGNFYHFRAKQVGRASIATVSLRVGVTGGGSAGHVVPALAVAAEFRRRGQDDLVFFGRADSIEERLATQAGLSFVALPAAGLRRYRSWKNLTLPFVVLWGIARAIITVRRSRISVLLCKGGYVSVPAAIGAWANRVPFAIHESDHSLGLANRILARFATKVLTSSPSTQVSVRGRKITGICTGLPVRPDLETADPGRFRVKHGLPPEGRVLLVFCGSSGSVRINDAVRSELDALLKDFLVVHVCGPSNVDEQLNGTPGHTGPRQATLRECLLSSRSRVRVASAGDFRMKVEPLVEHRGCVWAEDPRRGGLCAAPGGARTGKRCYASLGDCH